MLYATSLGPIETDEGAFRLYLAFLDHEAITPPPGRSEAETMKELAALAASRGETELLCEASLSAAGARYGFKSAKMPEEVAVGVAMLAFNLTVGPKNRQEINLGDTRNFLSAAATFNAASPWQFWDDTDAVVVETTTKGETRAYECSILGSAGKIFGLALYDQPGDLDRLRDMLDAGQPDGAVQLGSLAMTLSDGPAWAIEAFKNAFGLDALPVAMRTIAGEGLAPVRAEDLRTLSVALVASAQLTPDNLEAAGQIETELGLVDVSVRVSPTLDA